MSETPKEPDWRDGMVAAGALMVLLCGACSAWTATNDDIYFRQGAWLVGSPPILVGMVLIVIGIARRDWTRTTPLRWSTFLVRLDGGFKMAVGAILLMIGAATALLSVALAIDIVSTASRAHSVGLFNRALTTVSGVAVLSIVTIVAVIGGCTLYRTGQDLSR